MLVGYSPTVQALFGTLFTWGLTALGAALVFVFKRGRRKILDGSLGFAAGVMTAASYWSLLAPAIEMAENSGSYGSNGEWAFVPVAIGFAVGAAFVYAADILMPMFGIVDPNLALALESEPKKETDSNDDLNSIGTVEDGNVKGVYPMSTTTATKRRLTDTPPNSVINDGIYSEPEKKQNTASWRRILLLIVAITVHNIPEGLAVGVGFGAIGKSSKATFENARNLAIGIGIQNFPEGLAVSLPLRGAGLSVWKSFWYGQLSGMVEPIAGLIGAFAVSVAEPILPYALAFAAGAMIYVVVDDIIPEAQQGGNGKIASWWTIVGFLVMMSLDVGLG
ncbi:zinc transporter ZIP11-like [Lineus longissimus]|uniref:zinc transporter ZIP11-like n=1 Tax=Lineus longissimus TaxID=88925 RepID=UPI002B4F805B